MKPLQLFVFVVALLHSGGCDRPPVDSSQAFQKPLVTETSSPVEQLVVSRQPFNGSTECHFKINDERWFCAERKWQMNELRINFSIADSTYPTSSISGGAYCANGHCLFVEALPNSIVPVGDLASGYFRTGALQMDYVRLSNENLIRLYRFEFTQNLVDVICVFSPESRLTIAEQARYCRNIQIGKDK